MDLSELIKMTVKWMSWISKVKWNWQDKPPSPLWAAGMGHAAFPATCTIDIKFQVYKAEQLKSNF